ncbi:MAG: hypothetical protein EOO02_22140, partial [Chitinophagaceae bacterium]
MLKKLLPCIFCVAFVSLLASFRKDPVVIEPGQNNAPKKNAIRTIIVDPGHGGSDVGAHGLRSYEKTICLAVGLRLGKLLEQAFPDLKILYTRRTDVYPEIRAKRMLLRKMRSERSSLIRDMVGPMLARTVFALMRK